MSEAAWRAVLDALERDVAALEREGPRPGAAWEAPALGPLPAALRGRAAQLLDRARAQERRLARERDEVAAELGQLSARRTAAQRYRTD